MLSDISREASSASALINDRYLAGYIREAPGLHPELTFSYRPMRVAERQSFFREVERIREDDQVTHTARMMRERLKDWGLEEPLTAKTISELQPRLFDRVLLMITGSSPSDTRMES